MLAQRRNPPYVDLPFADRKVVAGTAPQNMQPVLGRSDHKRVDSGLAGVGGWTVPVPRDPPNLIRPSSSGKLLVDLSGCDS